MINLPKLDFLKSMLFIRMVEEELANRYIDQKIRCPMHLCIGQEAIAVGVSAVLQPEDKVYSNHRAHGHYLAKGGDLYAMVAELYGKKDGCSGGRGGSMHIIDLKVGFLGATPIVGGTVPLAVGTSWASFLSDQSFVTVVYIGDGCFEEGVIHECLNFSVLHKLPIIFICENNNYSVYTSLNERQSNRPIYKIAEAHGLKSFKSTGNDVENVYKLTSFAYNSIKSNQGPFFIEFETYRWREHCGPNYDNDLRYRGEEEIRIGLEDCPIEKYKNQLISENILNLKLLDTITINLKCKINNLFDLVIQSEDASPLESGKFVYAE